MESLENEIKKGFFDLQSFGVDVEYPLLWI